MDIKLWAYSLLVFAFATSSPAYAKMYKCKSKDGSLTYSATPCPRESTVERAPVNKRGDDGASTYLRRNNSKYTYKGFYDKFACGNVRDGLSVFPGKNTLTTMMRDIILEKKDSVHKLARQTSNYVNTGATTSTSVCYINVDKESRRVTLNFGLGSFRKSDIDSWKASQIANRLAGLGYSFDDLDQPLVDSYRYKWRNSDFYCSVEIHQDIGSTNPYLNVGARCSGRIK